MPIPTPLLRCCARGLARVAGLFVAGQAGADIAGEAFEAIWDYWQGQTDSSARAEEIQALAQADPAEVRAEVSRVVREEAGPLAEDQRRQLEVYLSQIPATIRRTLRRPSDPTGTTIPPGLALRKADDLLPFLPPRMPRFKPGDRPLAGVDWQLAELLGVGGFGEVWKAVHPHFDGMEPAALKFCLDESARDHLLRHEAAVLNQVMRQGRHEGVVVLQHTYLSADPPCLEYEYVSGGDLAGLIQEWHRSEQPPNPEQAGKVMLRLAEIVGFMHRLDPPVVHRDLKPANVLVQATPGGYALKVADFGIGGLAVRQAIEQTRRGTRREVFLASSLRGAYTPLYASPQQMRGEPPDPRDDVYALGVIWYQLLTGDLMKGRPGGKSWQRRLLEQGVPAAWLDLLLACVEDEPDDRPADANHFAGQLKGFLRASGSVPATTDPPPPAAVNREKASAAREGVVATASIPSSERGWQPGVETAQPSSRGMSDPLPKETLSVSQASTEQARPAPFRFRSGEEVHDVAGLAAACERHPDDAEWHLMEGHFEPWLRSAGHEELAETASEARTSGGPPRQALAAFLAQARQKFASPGEMTQQQVATDDPPSHAAAGCVMMAIPVALVFSWLIGAMPLAALMITVGLVVSLYAFAGGWIFRSLKSLIRPYLDD